jgi:hypothetical protein
MPKLSTHVAGKEKEAAENWKTCWKLPSMQPVAEKPMGPSEWKWQPMEDPEKLIIVYTRTEKLPGAHVAALEVAVTVATVATVAPSPEQGL